ncbi:EGF-like domain protein, partial [Ancylostoma caninum]
MCLCVGWMGEKCERGCPKGFYGPMCSKKCDLCNGISWADSNAACDPITGACKCERGYKGPDCKQRVCDEDMYGLDCSKQCTCIMENTESCAPDTGYCRCKPGYAGDSCERICSKLFWGKDCANTCECNYNVTSECDLTSGRCVCLPGRTGAQCVYFL